MTTRGVCLRFVLLGTTLLLACGDSGGARRRDAGDSGRLDGRRAASDGAGHSVRDAAAEAAAALVPDAAGLRDASPLERDAQRCSFVITPESMGCRAPLYCYNSFCGLSLGTCITIPTSCDATEAPVCSCGGETFRNLCELKRAAKSLAHVGACNAPCSVANPCPDDAAACDLPSCAVDAIGRCRPKAEGCTMEYEPQCGCDGKNYVNKCGRIHGSVGLAHYGDC